MKVLIKTLLVSFLISQIFASEKDEKEIKDVTLLLSEMTLMESVPSAAYLKNQDEIQKLERTNEENKKKILTFNQSFCGLSPEEAKRKFNEDLINPELAQALLDSQKVLENRGVFGFLEIIKQEAMKRKREADYLLGAAFYEGTECQKNFRKAFEQFSKAANQGHPIAQYNLGIMYSKGEGVQPNWRRAYDFFKLSAEQGYTDAMYNLFLCYFNGDGCEKSEENAEKWLGRAARAGNAAALDLITQLETDNNIKVDIDTLGK